MKKLIILLASFLLLSSGCQPLNCLPEKQATPILSAVELAPPRPHEWYIVKSFVDKWLQKQPDGTIWNLKNLERHCGHFTVVEIKANETTELNMTYTRIEDD